MFKKILILCFVFVASTLLFSCEDDDLVAISEAQDCLNKVEDANYTDALDCANKVSGIDTQQAKVILCSAYVLGGGLTTTRVANAYKQLNDSDSNAQSVYIAALTLDSVDTAKKAASACEDTKVTGLIYLGSLTLVGTALVNSVGGSLLTDIINGTINEAAIESAISNCQTTPANCNPADVGEAVLLLNETACDGDDVVDADVCADISSAVNATGGTSSAIGEALFCMLKDGATAAGCGL